MLCIVLDTNPFAWADLEPNVRFQQVLQDILVFVNAYLAVSGNKLAFIASHVQTARFIYPNNSVDGNANLIQWRPDSYRLFQVVNEQINKGIERLFQETMNALTENMPDDKPDNNSMLKGGNSIQQPKASESVTMLSGALSFALAYINRIRNTQSRTSASQLDARILVISVSSDLESQYIPIMNSIFCAQKLVRHSPVSTVFL